MSETVRLDRVGRCVWAGDGEVVLTRLEFDLLAHLTARPGVAVRTRDLLREVWHVTDEWADPRTVTEHIYRLRRKLPGLCVATLRGYGYRYDSGVAT